MNYLVTYWIDIEADCPEDAARQAHELIAHPDEASFYTYDVGIEDPKTCQDFSIHGRFTFNMQDQLTDESGNVKE
jgi:hypothetical protein